MKMIDNTIQEKKRKILFLKDCCSSGQWAIVKYCKELQEQGIAYEVETVGYFNVYHRKLHETYGFDIDALKKYCYIIDEEEQTISKFDNQKPKDNANNEENK